jgi:hypothetical protein
VRIGLNGLWKLVPFGGSASVSIKL